MDIQKIINGMTLRQNIGENSDTENYADFTFV